MPRKKKSYNIKDSKLKRSVKEGKTKRKESKEKMNSK
jgi:hypothetical protein